MEPQGEADRLGWCSTPVTVLFTDLKDSTELIRVLDPEAAQHLLDPAIHSRMDAVHRFEGTVNQVLGDGIMALFGAPIAHEDHALRACYVALAMQAAMRAYTEEVRRTHGLGLRMRVGLNAGKVVVRAIGNDLHMDYSAVGETTVLAACMDRLPLEEKRLLQTAAVSSRRCPGTSRHRPRPPGARPLSHAPLPSDNARAPRGSTSWAGTHPVGVGVARSIRSAISP